MLGINTWLRFHATLLALQPKFNRTSLACKKKFTAIFKAYKEDKMANGISGNDRHESKYYEAMNNNNRNKGGQRTQVEKKERDDDHGLSIQVKKWPF